MKSRDASAIAPLLVREAQTTRRLSQWKSDPRMTVWWATRLECASALTRLRREGMLQARAQRLLRVHPLRSADALQLAAALIATAENPSALPFLTSGDRLREAAQKEGFAVD
jgi:hypothetical protein